MEFIRGYTTQKDKSNSYTPGKCKCGKCSSFTQRAPCAEHNGVRDWIIGGVKCCGGFCTSQNRCAKIDVDQCSIGNSSAGKNPVADVAWNKKAPSVACKYKLSDIDTVKQVNKFVNKFGLNDQLMDKFCSQKVSNCPNKGSCSRLRSKTDGADLCRDWYEKQPNDAKDAFMQNYCITSNTYDCKCVNRSLDPIYNAIKPAKVINDGCWFTPCANPAKFYVPSQLVKPKCPKNVCDIIFQFINDKRIDINDVKNEINCSFGPSPSPTPSSSWVILGIISIVALTAVVMAKTL